MDYHQDRFEDCSLLIFKNDELVALMPANKLENKIYSHQGLTYGGLVLKNDIKFQIVLLCFQTLLRFLKFNNYEYLEIKIMPSIYSVLPNNELDYIMFLLKAKLTKSETLSVINQKALLNISKSRLEGVKRGNKNKLQVIEDYCFDAFWNQILIPNLKVKYNTHPIHSLREITLLKSLFPKNIRQFNVYYNNEIVAGTTIFETEGVAHCQYISGNALNNTLGSLDFLHYHLINDVFKGKKYFDFGTSNENEGKQINKGLHFWKEGFGARTIVQNAYKIDTNSFKLLDGVLI